MSPSPSTINADPYLVPNPLAREQRRDVQRTTSGYKPDRKRYRLTFEGTEHDGLQVVMKGLKVGDMLDMATLSSQVSAGDGMTPEQAAQMGGMYDLLGSSIVEWNLLDDDDRPIEPSAEALRNEEPSLSNAILNAWTQAVNGVAAPLDQPSTSGSRSGQVASIPMDLH